MPETDQHIENLIQDCKKGKQTAQLEIYNRYCKAMYNASLRIVKDRFAAEDIVQDSFLVAFTKLDSLREAPTFGAWLKKIVIRNSFDHYKSKRKQNEIPLDEVLYKVEGDGMDQPEENYTHLKAKQVMDTMNDLKENYRLVLTLHLIEGYDYEEVGSIMNISQGNCRTLISRAKDSLRKKLHSLVA